MQMKIARALDLFCKAQILTILHDIAGRTSKAVLKDLKFRWPKEHAQQEADLSKFHKRLEGRWSKPPGQLRMLLAMSREWCQESHNRKDLKTGKKKQLREI
jgi:hypothetical protein